MPNDVAEVYDLLVETPVEHPPEAEPSGFELVLQCRVALKSDLLVPRTGRVAIEVGYKGHLSDIHTTKASLWAIVVGDEIFMVPVAELRGFVRHERYYEVMAWNGSTSRIVLVPVEDLRQQPSVKKICLDGGRR